jgi:hypothetical protein
MRDLFADFRQPVASRVFASSERRSNRTSSSVPITDQKRQGGHDVALFPGWHEELNGCNG